MPNEFWAAIVGAVVGGVVTGLLQLVQQAHERSLRLAEQQDQQRALAYSLFYKLMIISSTFSRVSHHFETAFTKAPEGHEPWQFLEAYVSQHRHVVFSAEEMAMLLKVSKNSFNAIAAIDDVHNALSDTLVAFGSRKVEIHRMLPPAMVEGRRGVVFATHEQLMKATPLIIEANGIARDLRISVKRDAERTLTAMRELVPRLNLGLNMKISFELKKPEEWLDIPEA